MAASELALCGRHGRPSRQRGAAAVFAGVTIIMGLVCVGLAIDLGRYYYYQRDLQRLANMAALDSARAAGGCIGNVSNPLSVASSEAAASVQRNGGLAQWASGGVRVGARGNPGGVRYFDPAFDPKNRSVEVKLTRAAPSRLIPILGNTTATGNMTATAAAYSSPSATVRMGTQVVNVDTSGASSLNKLFTGLLGGPVNLSVASYNAFLAAQVPVQQLLLQLNIGSVQQLQNASVSQKTLLGALAAVLNAQGATVAGQAAQALAGVASASQQVLPSQVLGVNNPVTGATLTAANIAQATAELAASGSLINVPVGLPAPLNGLLALSLINPGSPTFLVPGGIDLFPSNFARNTQVLAQSTAGVNVDLPLILATVGIHLNLPLFVQVGKGTAEIDHLDCARRGQTQNLAYVRAQTGVINIGLGTFADPSAPGAMPDYARVLDTTITVHLLIYDINIKIGASARLNLSLASSNSVLPTPFTEGQTQHVGTPRLSQITSGMVNGNMIDVKIDDPVVLNPIPIVATLLNTVLGAIKPALDTLIRSQVVSLVAQLADSAVLPVLDQAGVTVGGADITVTDIDAQTPYLFTQN